MTSNDIDLHDTDFQNSDHNDNDVHIDNHCDNDLRDNGSPQNDSDIPDRSQMARLASGGKTKHERAGRLSHVAPMGGRRGLHRDRRQSRQRQNDYHVQRVRGGVPAPRPILLRVPCGGCERQRGHTRRAWAESGVAQAPQLKPGHLKNSGMHAVSTISKLDVDIM